MAEPTLKDYYNLTKKVDQLIKELSDEIKNFRDNTPLTEHQKAELEDGILWALDHTHITQAHWTEVEGELEYLLVGLEDGKHHREGK